MKTLTIAITLIISTYVVTAQASSCNNSNHAHDPRELAEMYFSQMDINGDGVVNKVEFEKSQMSQMIKSFDVLQPDKNGLVLKTAFIQAFIKAHSEPETEV